MNEKKVNSIGSQQRPRVSAPIIDFKQLWAMIQINRCWFVVSVFTCLFIAGLYLWFAPRNYVVTGKMEIIDKSNKNAGISAGMAMLNSLPMGLGNALGGSLGGSLGIDSEKEIIKSTSLVRNVVNELGLHTEYYVNKWGRSRMAYKNQPVNVSFDEAHLQWMDSELPLVIHSIKLNITKNDNEYQVETTLYENNKKKSLPKQSSSSLPLVVKTEVGNITISENKLLSVKDREEYSEGYKLKVYVRPPLLAANDLIDNLMVDPPTKKVSNILSITLKDENPVRAIDFINHLVDAYNERANADKNEEARKTDEFVNERLLKIDSELGSSDSAWEEYKEKFQITDPKVDAQEVMTKKSLYETQLVKLGTQLQLQDYLSEYVNNPANLYEIIPLSVGTTSTDGEKGQGAVLDVSAIVRHNGLVSNRKELLKSMSEKAPQVQRVTETIEELHPDILTAMARNRQSILIQKQSVQREYDHYLSKVGNTPQQERALTEIGRQREIKQGVYLLMLQKREETAMELANVTNKGKLIDETQMNMNSKTPRSNMVIIAALFMGVALPLGFLVVLLLLKTKISVDSELVTLIKHPFLGVLSKDNEDDNMRSLRTNLLLHLKSDQKVILVASHNDGDGKSYVSQQLSDCLSQIGKKTIICSTDLRTDGSRAQFAEFLKSEGYSWPGVQNLNSADLLFLDDFRSFISQIKEKYDYVILDTPSIARTNDVYQIATFADATCVVVKADSTTKSFVEGIEKDNRFI